MAYDVRVINELVQQESAFAERLLAEVGKVVIGQRAMVERILIGLLTGGHRGRVSEETEAALKRIAWWDWCREELISALPDFRALDADVFAKKYDIR